MSITPNRGVKTTPNRRVKTTPNRRVRIGIVTQSYYPRFGGVTEHVHASGMALARRGHEVTVITSRFNTNPSAGLAVERIGRNVLIPFNRAFVDLTVGWNLKGRLREAFRRHDFDLIHVHCPAAPSLPLLAVAAAECPVVGTFHMTGQNALQDLVRVPLARRMERLDARIAVSTTAEACAEHYFGGTYSVIPNGVDTDRFHPDAVPFDAWRADDKINVVFVGRLDPRKGVEHLIQAAPEVVSRTAGRARFLIVGDSYLRRRLEASVPRAVRESMVFLGAVPSAELPRWYATADICVAPATGNESFGIVLLEAMASGRAVVCSDIPGYRSVAVSGRNAVLHPPGDVAALAEALVALVADADRRARLGAHGRQRALEFSWPSVARRIEGVYESLMDVPAAAPSKTAPVVRSSA